MSTNLDNPAFEPKATHPVTVSYPGPFLISGNDTRYFTDTAAALSWVKRAGLLSRRGCTIDGRPATEVA